MTVTVLWTGAMIILCMEVLRGQREPGLSNTRSFRWYVGWNDAADEEKVHTGRAVDSQTVLQGMQSFYCMFSC